MKITTTARGFALIKFTDGNGEDCTLQKSSAAEQDMIWLGTEDAKPQVGPPWRPVEFPKNTQFTTRMHLTREQVKELLPYLQKFVKRGDL